MSVRVRGVCKSFGALRVLENVSFQMDEGDTWCLMGPSGAGKTTLLRIMLGLEAADDGAVEGLDIGDASVVFQEDRLCNALTPIENLALVMPGRASRRELRALLSEILPSEALDKPVINLSGGQRRRVSLARAMAYPGTMVVMDEPFTGLDMQTKRTVIDFVLRHLNGRTLLVSTHGERDAELLGARRVELFDLSGEHRRA
ncbi:ATP-binding cassette domain-containing protein [Gordonibacter sp. Marseille-P4307]|uniref:ATP-binding cassette domain-containing protein n=1 Tax=Gordonibacter sp. Marseille-P4307 TaxID=2161815 RepID=UPI000F54467E|nr:ATP-binding cassette domain-containing protein [Gordonibacter sp. Marseille-P4307]